MDTAFASSTVAAQKVFFPTWHLLNAFRYKNVWGKLGGSGDVNATQPKLRWGEWVGHWHAYRLAQMHSGNTASVAIHPREKQTRRPSDSDEQGVGERPN